MDSATWSLMDIVVLVYLVVGTLIGCRRGLSGELARLISLAIALVAALALYRPAGAWMAQHTRLEAGMARAVAFVVAIAAAGALMLVLRAALKAVIKRGFSETTDKVGGVIAGLAGSCLAVILVFLAASIWPHPYLNRKFGEESVIGRWIQKTVAPVRERIESLPVTRTLQDRVETVTEAVTENVEKAQRTGSTPASSRRRSPSR